VFISVPVLVTTRSQVIQKYVTLSDGRRLGFVEYGDRQGRPVFYFHGFPGSRLEAKLAETTALDTHVRFIGIDRPGYGISDFKPERKFVDWADDVIGLADSLGFDRFSILGVSGGGPYAAACAFKIPDRLNAVGIVCGMGPVDVPGLNENMPWMYRRGLRLASCLPAIVSAVYPFLAFLFRNYPGFILSILSAKVEAPDKTALKNKDLREALSASFQEAFRRSLRWPAADVVLYSRPWGFRLQDINIPVHLWHGERDRIVPAAMARYLAKIIPNCQANFYADDGHFSIILNRIEEIWKIFCT
jgi:pimeloyl-ACP methyl ester carboxylesterase